MKFRLTNKPNRMLSKDWALYIVSAANAMSFIVMSDSEDHARELVENRAYHTDCLVKSVTRIESHHKIPTISRSGLNYFKPDSILRVELFIGNPEGNGRVLANRFVGVGYAGWDFHEI